MFSCLSTFSLNAASWQVAFVDQNDLETARNASCGQIPTGALNASFNLENPLDLLALYSRRSAPAEPKDGRSALLIHAFDSEEDGELLCSGGADWYLAVYCNGRECFENLRHGNGGKPVTSQDQVFTVPVKKGKNHLTLLVRPGSKGWEVAFQRLEDTPLNRSRLPGSTGGSAEKALNFQPWITDIANGEATIRFVTKCASYAAVDFRKQGGTEWSRLYDRIGLQLLWSARHAILLKQLEPDGVYEFRIVLFMENETRNGHLPALPQKAQILPGKYQFRSAPAPDAGFRFVAMSDTHLPTLSRRAMLKQYDRQFDFGKFGFFVHLGDIAGKLDNFDDQVLYGFTDHFNRDGRILPLCVVHGNHEYSGRESDRWLAAFGTPTGEAFRAFRYGNTFFVVLEYWGDQGGYDRKVEEWAVRALQSEASRSAAFRVVMNHSHAFWPNHPQAGMNVMLERLDKVARLHLFLNGHTHCYCRTDPKTGSYLTRPELVLKKDENVPTACVTLTLNGGESASELNLTEVAVTSDRMQIRSAQVDGTVFDEFAIDRAGTLLGK